MNETLRERRSTLDAVHGPPRAKSWLGRARKHVGRLAGGRQDAAYKPLVVRAGEAAGMKVGRGMGDAATDRVARSTLGTA